MKLLPVDVLEVLKSSALPGTVFVEVDDFTSKNAHQHKTVLAIVKREDNKWGNPTFVTLIKVVDGDARWVINPWLNEELIERLVKLPTPARAMSRIPTSIIDQLVSEVPSLDSLVEEVAETVRKNVSKT